MKVMAIQILLEIYIVWQKKMYPNSHEYTYFLLTSQAGGNYVYFSFIFLRQ
jgi:hypothetical protein